MSKEKIISPTYFNVDMSKENSILKNAEYQDNDIAASLNKIEEKTKELQEDIERKDKITDNIVNINFKKDK